MLIKVFCLIFPLKKLYYGKRLLSLIPQPEKVLKYYSRKCSIFLKEQKKIFQTNLHQNIRASL